MRIQQQQIQGTLVPEGKAGTGAAVILDKSSFDPVQFALKEREYLRERKDKKEKERTDFSRKALEEMTVKGDGFYYRNPINMKFSETRLKWSDPNKIDLVMKGNTPEAAEFYQNRADLLAANAAQLQLDALIRADLKKVSDNPNKYDKESVERLKAIANETVDFDTAIQAYKQGGGSLLAPAYDVEDVIKSMNITPAKIQSQNQAGQIVVTQSYDPDDVESEIERFKTNPQNAPAWDYLTKKLGGEDKVVEYIKSDFADKSKVSAKNAPKAGAATKMGSATFFDNGAGDYRIGVNLQGKNGGTLPLYNFVDEEGQRIFGSASRLVENNDGKRFYEIMVPKSGSYTSITREDALGQGLDIANLQVDPNDSNKFIQVSQTKPAYVPVSDVNTSAIKSQLGNINPLNILQEAKGETKGATTTKPSTTSAGQTVTEEEYRKMSVAERKKRGITTANIKK